MARAHHFGLFLALVGHVVNVESGVCVGASHPSVARLRLPVFDFKIVVR